MHCHHRQELIVSFFVDDKAKLVLSPHFIDIYCGKTSFSFILLQNLKMKILIVVSFLFIGAYCAPLFNEQLDNDWNLFKRVHQRQYNSVEEESHRYVDFDWKKNFL